MSPDVKIGISLLLPFLLVLWLFAVTRRKAAENQTSTTITAFARSGYWLGGLLLFSIICPLFILYITAQLPTTGTMTETKVAMPSQVLWSILIISGLWGSLVPYRSYAREGKRTFWLWLLGAVIFALLYYILSLFME